MGNLLRHLHHAARGLVRTPGFTLLAVLTLGLGIGANSAVLSVIDAVLLRPLAFPDADRLVRVRQVIDAETRIAPVRLDEWQRMSRAFRTLTGYYPEDASDTTGEFPERIRRAAVTPGFFETWGVGPMLGRGFTAAEFRDAGSAVVVLSESYWRQRFGADPNVLGRSVRIGEQAYSVIGVMPASFHFPERDVALWWPYVPPSASAVDRQAQWYIGIGRLEPGVTVEQARADLAAVQARLGELHPDPDARIGVSVVPLKEFVVGGARSSLWLLLGAVGVLLLITCSNVAALLVTRAAERDAQTAVRYALGASRRSVVTQFLAEAAVLVLAGAVLGLLVAAGATGLIRALAPELPRLGEVGFDARVFAYTLGSALLVAVLCGLLPAIRASRTDRSLLGGARGEVSGNRLQWSFVGVQVALSVTLLAGAGLLARSFEQLSRVDPGFDPAGVLVLRLSGDWSEKSDWNRLERRIDGTLAALQALPGVESVATAWQLPGTPTQYGIEFELLEGRADGEAPLLAEWRTVSPGYFAAARIPQVAGDACRLPGASGSTREIMVNRSFASRYFAGRQVSGLNLAWEGRSESGRIAGIVGDARESGMDRDPVPTVYVCDSAPNPFPWFLLRTRGDPLATATAVRTRLKELEPLRSVYELGTLEQRIDASYAENRLRLALLALFAATALALTCLGVYATLAYVVSLRRREIGLRMALGARAASTVRQFVAKALRVAGAACVLGVALALLLNRGLASMLYGVAPSDPLTFAAAIAVVLAVAAVAALVPALRASRIEPTQALRDG